jgi:HAD superfamily hydrolase (TIGR01509 family)
MRAILHVILCLPLNPFGRERRIRALTCYNDPVPKKSACLSSITRWATVTGSNILNYYVLPVKIPRFSKAPPTAVLFDMDGTLTEPRLDFPRLKAEMGIGARPILEALAEMSESQRSVAEAILHRHEEEAAKLSTLNPGCREILAWLDARSIPVALITRNSRASVKTVLAAHGLPIDVLVTREDAPPKPDPAPLLHACEGLKVPAVDVWMVGDGEYDVRAGLAAGVRTVWLSHRREKHFPEAPWQTVADLWELRDLLESAIRAE